MTDHCAQDPARPTRYTLEWETIETHEAIVTADELAELLGIDVDQMDPADPVNSEAYYESNVSIEDSLAEIEGDDTFEFLTRHDVGATPVCPPNPRS